MLNVIEDEEGEDTSIMFSPRKAPRQKLTVEETQNIEK